MFELCAMQRKLIYLINPISGTRKKPLLKELITKETRAAGWDFEILDTRSDGDYSWLRRRVLNEPITDIVICGGDGSVSTVTSFLLELDIAIGIIPMGSGNGLALAAGISSSSIRALGIILQGRSAPIDGLMINDKFSCMMCGIGSDAQVAHDFATQKKRGLQTYLRLSALHYFKAKSYPFSVTVHGQSFDTNAYFIIIANSNQFGNNVTIAPRASLNDGLFDVVIVKKMHKLVLPFALLHQIAGINALAASGKHTSNRNIVYFQASELRILNHGRAPLHIDGEPEQPVAAISCKILPNAFRLLQPLG